MYEQIKNVKQILYKILRFELTRHLIIAIASFVRFSRYSGVIFFVLRHHLKLYFLHTHLVTDAL